MKGGSAPPALLVERPKATLIVHISTLVVVHCAVFAFYPRCVYPRPGTVAQSPFQSVLITKLLTGTLAEYVFMTPGHGKRSRKLALECGFFFPGGGGTSFFVSDRQRSKDLLEQMHQRGFFLSFCFSSCFTYDACDKLEYGLLPTLNV